MAAGGAGPRSGRVGHAVNRRTRPRQNLLYGGTGESRAAVAAARRADARVKLNYLVRFAPSLNLASPI